MRILINFNKKDIDWNYTLRCIYSRLRRRVLVAFRPYYVLHKLMMRKGKCNKYYCKKVHEHTPFSCKYMNQDGSCQIYHTSEFPIDCFIAPIDEKELVIEQTEDIGFYWDKE